MMYDHGVIKFYLNFTYSCKLGNSKFGIVDQHINATCHM